MLEPAQVEAFRRGDESAVRAVYQEYGRLVFAVAHRVLSDRGLAEEATQHTFVQAWRSAGSFGAERDLAPWLASIARNAAIDIHRRESRRKAEPLESAVVLTLPPDEDSVYETWQVRRAVDTLAPEDRELVRLQHFEGYTHVEIAERLDVPVGTVKSRSFRIHRTLADRLAHLREAPA